MSAYFSGCLLATSWRSFSNPFLSSTLWWSRRSGGRAALTASWPAVVFRTMFIPLLLAVPGAPCPVPTALFLRRSSPAATRVYSPVFCASARRTLSQYLSWSAFLLRREEGPTTGPSCLSVCLVLQRLLEAHRHAGPHRKVGQLLPQPRRQLHEQGVGQQPRRTQFQGTPAVVVEHELQEVAHYELTVLAAVLQHHAVDAHARAQPGEALGCLHPGWMVAQPELPSSASSW